MTTTAEVQELISRAYSAPFGAPRTAAWERAAWAAEELGDPKLLLDTRLELGSSYHAVPNRPDHFTTYGWLLAQLDTDLPTAEQRSRILWMSKWVMSGLPENPEISRAVIERMYDDIRGRLETEGYTGHVFAHHRTMLALDFDEPETAREWMAQWMAASRDSMSDCRACEQRALGLARQVLGDLPGALQALDPALRGEMSCGHEPHISLSYATLWLAEAGRYDEARETHLRGWRLVQDDPALSTSAARHLMFLVRSGNLHRAVRLLAPRLAWLDQLNALDRLEFAAAAVPVVESALAAGVDLPSLGIPDPDALLAELGAMVEDLTVVFDRRNGTTNLSRILTEWTDPTPYPERVDLGVFSEEPFAAPVVLVGGAEVVDAASAPALAAALAEAKAEFATYRIRLVEQEWRERRDELIAAGRGQGLDVELERAIANLDRQVAAGADEELAVTLLASAADAARQAGDEVLVLRVEVERAARAAAAGDETALSSAWDAVTRLKDLGELSAAGSAIASINVPGGPDDGARWSQESADLYAAAGEHLLVQLSLIKKAWFESWIDPEAARPTLAAVRLDADAPATLRARLAQTAAQVERHSGDLEAAIRAGESALMLANESDDPIECFLAGTSLCGDLIEVGRWEQLEATADGVLLRARQLEDPLVRAEAQRYVGLARLETGRSMEAAEVLEAALPVLRERRSAALAPALWALSGAYREVGDLPSAQRSYEEAAAAFVAAERLAEASAAFGSAGGCALERGEAGTAAALFDRATRRRASMRTRSTTWSPHAAEPPSAWRPSKGWTRVSPPCGRWPRRSPTSRPARSSRALSTTRSSWSATSGRWLACSGSTSAGRRRPR